ncbi:hypothetical protein CIPAW_11G149900 [Carya illinoinensis]|uniref:Uncharacterized protein n=1 Tax=Carya illinoinensis TaxID=32201 RepID=A0A8T1P595_CARIL|nr:hypothetical protein CIPAW_11G149900 [Carya illinoinensis]
MDYAHTRYPTPSRLFHRHVSVIDTFGHNSLAIGTSGHLKFGFHSHQNEAFDDLLCNIPRYCLDGER